MKRKKIYTMALASTMAALSVALDLFSMRSDTSRYTIYALPLLLAGMMFGPIIGGLAGLAEGIIIQLITYGFTPTTILWVIAPCAWGLISGLIAKIFKYKLTPIKVIINVMITSFIALFINTLALILDGLIYHQPTAYVYANLGIRILTAFIIGIFYIIMILIILPRISSKYKNNALEEKTITCETTSSNKEINITLKIKK